MDDLTPLMALKAVLFVLPSVGLLALTSLVWRGRVLGATGRAWYGAMGTILLVTAGCVVLGGWLGMEAYDHRPGYHSCRELECLAVIGWVITGGIIGLPVGLVAGWSLRRLGARHPITFHLPSAALLLASLAAEVFNSDMLR